MGLIFENAFTEVLNVNNFNYRSDLTEVENTIREYFTQYGYTLVEMKILEIEGQPRKLSIRYNTPNGGSTIDLTIHEIT